jgi:hypothetical protein
MEPGTITCKHCGNQFQGNYCNQCGEKVHAEHHKRVGHILEEAFHFITHLDGTLFMNLRAIFTRPGKMSLEYCNGIRKKYFKPISFFLLCVVLYLLFPKFHGLNMKMNTFHQRGNSYAWLSRPAVREKMRNNTMTYEQVQEKYDTKSLKVSKVFLLVLLPLIAFVLYVLFSRQRRYFFDHFIYATEFGSLWIIIQFLLMPLLVSAITLAFPNTESFFHDDNPWVWVIIVMLFFSMVATAFRRFYQQAWAWSLVKAFIFIVAFQFVVLYIYHSLLFLTVMLFV